MSTTKIVKTRDQATAALRKIGIKRDEYAKHIKKLDNGTFEVRFMLEEPKLEKAVKERKPTCSSVTTAMILAGKSNADIWAVIKPQFKLDDTKRHYPTWYRCRIKREGKIKDVKEAT